MIQQSWQEVLQTRPPFDFIPQLTNNWMLVTAGGPGGLGTMTVSWGGQCFIWGKDVVLYEIRDSRNTLKYLKKHSSFSLTLFEESYRDKLTYCGRHTGREVDKVSQCQFTPCFYGPEQVPYFDQAHTALICRQVYRSLMAENDFLEREDSELWQAWYNTGAHTGDRHHLILASVEKILTKGEAANAEK